MRQKDRVEKTFADLPDLEKFVAAALGRKGMELFYSGVLRIVQRSAVCSQAILEAVQKRDVKKIRLLADALEAATLRKPHDPLRTELLRIKLSGEKPPTAQELADRTGGTVEHARRTAKELGVRLASAARGRPKGTGRKLSHRARK